jgi:hypothetical protein
MSPILKTAETRCTNRREKNIISLIKMTGELQRNLTEWKNRQNRRPGQTGAVLLNKEYCCHSNFYSTVWKRTKRDGTLCIVSEVQCSIITV